MTFAFSKASANIYCFYSGKDSITICTFAASSSSSLFAVESGIGHAGISDCFVRDSIVNEVSTDSTLLQLNQENARHTTTLLTDNQKKRRLALFAFPFPFGLVAAHRVMLGTKPWVPIVYIATFGGCFGILPLIDFCVILCSKDITQYENNPNIFMWIK